MNWSSRVPPRPIRRSTTPYPPRYRAVCQCGWHTNTHDAAQTGNAAYAHAVLTGHTGAVEIIPL